MRVLGGERNPSPLSVLRVIKKEGVAIFSSIFWEIIYDLFFFTLYIFNVCKHMVLNQIFLHLKEKSVHAACSLENSLHACVNSWVLSVIC